MLRAERRADIKDSKIVRAKMIVLLIDGRQHSQPFCSGTINDGAVFRTRYSSHSFDLCVRYRLIGSSP